jgi:hypothetical protein
VSPVPAGESRWPEVLWGVRRTACRNRSVLWRGEPAREMPRLWANARSKHSRSRHGVAAQALHLLGEIAPHPDRFDAASGEGYYRKALALDEPRGMRPLIAHCHLGLGKLFRRTGKRQEAHEHLTTATTMYREMDMPFWLDQAASETAALG